jgi:TolB protein
MDFRPAWSHDGRQLGFVRDDSRDTWIVVRDLETGSERVVNTPAIDLDPVFGPEGEIIYSSAAAGRFDLWVVDGAALTEGPAFELKPSLSRDGEVLVHLEKGGGLDRIVARNRRTGQSTELLAEGIISQTRPAVSPDGTLVAYNWPTQDGYELRVLGVEDPRTSVLITPGDRGLPLSPAWSPDGVWLWFTEAGADEVMRLYRVPADGGVPEEAVIRVWDWGAAVGTLRVVTRDGGSEEERTQTAARLSVVDGAGHPAVPSSGYAQFDGQNGRVFFYTPGVIDVVVPVGTVTVGAVRGLTTPEVSRAIDVRAGEVTEVELVLESVWDAAASGFLSGDHHFHLNYGGPFRLAPEDLPLMMRGENLDVATPLLANLHNRFEDQALWGWERGGSLPLIRFGQEVRSHFLGHVSLLDTRTLFWPWIWGPGYQVYGADDRPNSAALAHARSQGAIGGYVHPVRDQDPFAPENAGNLPVLFAVDGILGNMDWIELSVLWSDEIGASEMWYRFLNLGVPIVLEGGTDVMNNFYRTMPVGVSRLYVQTAGEVSMAAYMRGMKEGRSFVTTGPMLDVRIDGVAPGDVVSGGRSARFNLDLASAVPVETVEVLVNGVVAWSSAGLERSGSRSYEGSIELPEAGWVAVRAHGGETMWPAADSYSFAHTSPVWIGHVGSTDPDASRRSAEELMPLVDAAEARLRATYGDVPIPRILADFEAARAKLEGR